MEELVGCFNEQNRYKKADSMGGTMKDSLIAVAMWCSIMLCVGLIVGVSSALVYLPIHFIWRVLP